MFELKKHAKWTIAPDYHFSLIRWNIDKWYGYGVPKNHLKKFFSEDGESYQLYHKKVEASHVVTILTPKKASNNWMRQLKKEF